MLLTKTIIRILQQYFEYLLEFHNSLRSITFRLMQNLGRKKILGEVTHLITSNNQNVEQNCEALAVQSHTEAFRLMFFGVTPVTELFKIVSPYGELIQG